MADYLHNHAQFSDLIRIVAQQRRIDPALVEKDYWIMHCLYGLQQLGLTFELKGGTSLSKGFQIINRFSEDIDIRIEPPAGQDVKTGRNQTKPAQVKSRKDFYDWLATTIRIDGIEKVERDTAFDNKDFFNIVDNRAKGVACYDPGYTFVEKLQTVSTKFRRQQESGDSPVEFMRHYYDVYSLLQRPEVRAFIGTEPYKAHKAKRFRSGDNPNIAQNEAFILSDRETRKTYERAYVGSSALYYGDKPSFGQILEEIQMWVDRL